jgi:hypothetical protein
MNPEHHGVQVTRQITMIMVVVVLMLLNDERHGGNNNYILVSCTTLKRIFLCYNIKINLLMFMSVREKERMAYRGVVFRLNTTYLHCILHRQLF